MNWNCLNGLFQGSATRKMELLSFFTHKIIVLVFKKYVERGQTAVYPGDVLLEIDFIFLVKACTGIDALFHHAKAIPKHYDFMKESFNWNFLWLHAIIERFEDHGSVFPFIAKVNHF